MKYKLVKDKFVKLKAKEIEEIEANESEYKWKMIRGKVVALSAKEITELEAKAKEVEKQRPVEEAKAKILELEALKTIRRLTDAILTQDGKKWLQDLEAQIELQREIIGNAT